MTAGRSERRKQQLREDILTAAYRSFFQHGVAATTIEHICGRADIANRTFFNHFPSRDAMMRALAERQWRSTYAILDDHVARHPRFTIAMFFDAFATAVHGSTDSHPELSAALIDAAGFYGSRGSDLHARVVELVRRGASDGTVTSGHDPDVLADIIIGTLTAATATWAANPASSLADRLHHLGVALADLVAPTPAGRP